MIGHPVAKTAVVAKAVTPGPAPVAKTAVVAAAVTPGRPGAAGGSSGSGSAGDYIALSPPSMENCCELIIAPESAAGYSTAWAISSGVVWRPSGMIWSNAWRAASEFLAGEAHLDVVLKRRRCGAGVQRVDAHAARGELLGQHPHQTDLSVLGRAVPLSPGNPTRPATLDVMTMLPPSREMRDRVLG